MPVHEAKFDININSSPGLIHASTEQPHITININTNGIARFQIPPSSTASSIADLSSITSTTAKSVSSPKIPDGIYAIRSRATAGVIHLNGDSKVVGHQDDANRRNSQMWLVVAMAGTDCYCVSNMLTGKIMELYGGSANNHTPVQASTPHYGPNQLWFVQQMHKKSTYYAILNSQARTALDLTGASTVDGTAIVGYEHVKTAEHQQWEFVPVS